MRRACEVLGCRRTLCGGRLSVGGGRLRRVSVRGRGVAVGGVRNRLCCCTRRHGSKGIGDECLSPIVPKGVTSVRGVRLEVRRLSGRVRSLR